MSLPAPEGPCCLLVDNGSLQPAATLNLRRMAAALSARAGRLVEPVSLLHSSTIPVAELEGRAAEILEPALRARVAAGAREFLVLPAFFGPSAALTDYIPQRTVALARSFPGLRVQLAAPLVDPAEAGDRRVARAVADKVRAAAGQAGLGRPGVVLVDHGSPQPAVGAVRDHVARQLAEELGREASFVIAASMERREGAAFDFNEPLLERALAAPPLGDGAGEVVAALLFLSPGRHAGPGGDIETICRAAGQRHRGLRVHVASTLGDHPLIVEVLADRLREALARLANAAR